MRQYGQAVGALVADAFARDTSGTARITTKLNTIIIPRIEFRDASIREAIDFLRQQAVENDPSTEGKKGVDIVLRLAPLGQVAPPPVPVAACGQAPLLSGCCCTAGAAAGGRDDARYRASDCGARQWLPRRRRLQRKRASQLRSNQIPLGEALRYIANQAGLKVKVEPYAVSIIPITEQSNDLITKEYRVPPDFISTAPTRVLRCCSAALTRQAPGTAAFRPGTGKIRRESTGGQQLVNREGAKEFLESSGRAIPAGRERKLPSAEQPPDRS